MSCQNSCKICQKVDNGLINILVKENDKSNAKELLKIAIPEIDWDFNCQDPSSSICAECFEKTKITAIFRQKCLEHFGRLSIRPSEIFNPKKQYQTDIFWHSLKQEHRSSKLERFSEIDDGRGVHSCLDFRKQPLHHARPYRLLESKVQKNRETCPRHWNDSMLEQAPHNTKLRQNNETIIDSEDNNGELIKSGVKIDTIIPPNTTRMEKGNKNDSIFAAMTNLDGNINHLALTTLEESINGNSAGDAEGLPKIKGDKENICEIGLPKLLGNFLPTFSGKQHGSGDNLKHGGLTYQAYDSPPCSQPLDLTFKEVISSSTELIREVEQNMSIWRDICKDKSNGTASLTSIASELESESVLGTEEDPFQCSQCGRNFPTWHKLQVHVEECLGRETTSCLTCREVFSTESALCRHVYGKTYPCRICGKRYRFCRTYVNHMLEKHGVHEKKEDFECPICFMRLRTDIGLRRHVRTNHKGLSANDMFGCGFCKRRFLRRTNLTRHLRLKHNKETANCEN